MTKTNETTTEAKPEISKIEYDFNESDTVSVDEIIEEIGGDTPQRSSKMTKNETTTEDLVQINEYIPESRRHDPNDTVEGDIKITHYVRRSDGLKAVMNDEAEETEVSEYKAVISEADESFESWNQAREYVKREL